MVEKDPIDPIMNTDPHQKTNKLHNKRSTISIIILSLVAVSTFYWLLVRIGLIFPVTIIPEILCISHCQTSAKLHDPIQGNELLNYDQPLEKLIINPHNKEKISLLIEKSKFRLTIYHEFKPIKSYPVVFGNKPTGDKKSQGDHKTPEGILKIENLYPHPQWSKFIWLNYPNSQSWRKHFQAKINGELPWNIPIGGEVGIHGVPSGGDGMIDERNNWTLGCPSLKNQDVNELYPFLQKGTVVEIVP